MVIVKSFDLTQNLLAGIIYFAQNGSSVRFSYQHLGQIFRASSWLAALATVCSFKAKVDCLQSEINSSNFLLITSTTFNIITIVNHIYDLNQFI